MHLMYLGINCPLQHSRPQHSVIAFFEFHARLTAGVGITSITVAAATRLVQIN
jgi:hypothetical protein